MLKKLSWTVASAAILAVVLVANDSWRTAETVEPSWLDRSLSETGIADGLIPRVEAAPPEPPVAEAGSGQTVAVDDTVVLDASGSYDPKGSVVDFSWQLITVPSGSLAALSDTTAVKPTLVPDLAGDYVVELVVSQGNRTSDPDTVTISTNNTAPVADAGHDRAVFVSDVIELDAGGSTDVDGDALTYAWTVVSVPAGSAATLSDPTAVRPDFTADVAGDYAFDLVVVDGTASSAADRVTISTDSNIPPRAETGPNRGASVGQTVPMDPSFSSDANGDEISLEWNVVARPSASSANIVKPKDDSPRFDVDVAGLYVVQVELTDDPGAVSFETMVVSTGNVPPYTNAGPDQSALVSDVVTLDGTGSTDVNGDAIAFDWALLAMPAGSTAALSDPTAGRPTFTVDVAGLYVAQLIVRDGTEAGRADTVVVSTSNSTPFAHAGADQTVSSGDTVQLDGTGSDDADLDALSYDWALTLVPKGSSAAISDPAAVSPTFTANKKGVYVAQLTVDDGTAESPADGLVIRTTNSRPLANAGADQSLNLGDLMQLDGSASTDADNEALTYSWALIVRPAGSTAALSSATIANPTFTIDVNGLYVAQLIVSDGLFDSEADTVVAEALNSAPTADAGPDQSVTAGAAVQLDGSGSSDPENDPLAYAWSLASVPTGSAASLSDPSAVNPSFTTDAPGPYVAQLVVSDGELPSPADQVTVTANPVTTSNVAPVLNPVGDQSVDLGAILSLTLTATDVNGDALAFSASPLPLPAGASLDGMTGDFSFTPDASQVGTIDLTFTVSDGLLMDSESIVITVNGSQPGGQTAISGRLLDSIDANQGITTPIVGAVISVAGDPTTTTSDVNGDFTLSGIPSGSQVFEVDSTTANPAPDGSDYASFHEELVLIDSVTNVLAQAVYLPRIDPAGIAVVDPQATTMVENTNIDVTMEVPPNTAKDEQGNDFSGELSISEVPVDFAPMALPEDLQPTLLISIQPTGVTFATPVPITFPNTEGLTPGSQVDIYSLDPEEGQFVIVGTGTVSADGSEIVTTSGGIRDASWHMILPPAADPEMAGAEPFNNPNDGCQDGTLEGGGETDEGFGSSAAACTGRLGVNHELASYRSLNRSRSLNFVYNSTSADPQPVLRADATITMFSAIPDAISAEVDVGGVAQGAPVFTDTAGLVVGQDETVTQAVQFDASDIETGSYAATLRLTNHFGNANVSARTFSRVLVNNESASPFGAGWTLDGLERLHVQSGGALVTLTRGDGAIMLFRDAGKLVTGGSAVPSPAPASLQLGTFESDSEIRVIEESENLPLSAALDLDDLQPQGSILLVNWHDLPPDMRVNSHLFHFDPLGSPGSVNLSGSVTFPSDVVGVIFEEATLNAGDAIVGDAGVIYPAANRAAEAGAGDTVTLSADLRTVTVDLTAGADIDQLRVVTVSETASLVESRFDDDAEGWTVIDNFNHGVTYQATGGNPGGNIFSDDGIGGPIWRWSAPAKFLGDQSAAYGGLLTYDSQQCCSGNQFNDFDVTLVGGGLTLTYDLPYNPGTGWTHYAAPLNEAAGWQVSGEARAPTQGEMQAVLANLGELHIRGEFVSGGDSSELDNVVLSATTGSPLVRGDFIAPPGEFSTLDQNPDSSFTRTLTDGTVIDYDAAGLMTARTDRNGNATLYGYDGQDRLTTITDPVGKVTTLAYGGDGLLDTVTDPASRVTTFQHDAAGDLTRIIDPDLSERDFAYDARHRLTSQTSKRDFATTYDHGFHGRVLQANWPDSSTRKVAPAEVVGLIDPASGQGTQANPAPFTRPDAVVASFTDGNDNTTTNSLDGFGYGIGSTDALNRTLTSERDTNGLVTRFTAANGRVDEFTYDSNGNMLTRTQAVSDPLERVTTFVYEPVFNQVTQVTDPANKVTTFDYDANGNLTKITDALLGERTFTHNAQGQVLTATDENLNVTTFVYDTDGNLESVTDAETNETRFTRDTAGRATAVTEGFGAPEARATTFTYDAMNRVLTATDGENGTTTLTYDAAGNATDLEDATNVVQLRSYDSRERLTQIDDPATGITDLTYDSDGNLETVTDALSAVTTFEYDAANRRTKTIDALLNEQLFAYDDNNNLTSLTDARGNPTTFAYDLLDRMTTDTNPLSQTATFAYDSRDNLTSVTDPKSQTVTYGYDDLSRLTMITTPDNTIVFGFDPASNITSVTDNDSDVSFTYDGLNRQATAGTNVGGAQPLVTLTNVYDALSNRSELLDSAGGTTLYAYDAADRLTQLTTPANDIVDLAYDPAGRLTQILFPNGITSDYVYDIASGRLTDLTHSLVAVPQLDFDYGYNGVGNVNSIVQPAETRSFGYDDLQRLISGGTAGTPESYAYDAEGNRTSSHLSASHTTDIANRLSDDDAFCYVYDLNGNVATKTAKVVGACTGDVTTYSYDAQDQLIRIDFPDLTAATYRYDGLGRRIEKDVDGTITKYVYDGLDILLEYDGANVLQARYSHGDQIDQPLALETSGQNFFYQTDHQGSIRQLTDSLGGIANSYTYDSYGRIETSSETVPNPYLYTAREFDSKSGLYYYRARYYDAEMGRFMSEDPIGFGGGGSNLYRYVFNDPLNRVDPSGLFAQSYPIAKTIELLALLLTKLLLDDLDSPGDDQSDPSPNDDDVPDNEPCPPAGDDNGGNCEKLYEIDTNTCNGISRVRGKKAGQRCHASAAERFAACLAGKPIPPLDTWNN